MAQSIDLSANALVGVTRDALVSLCSSLLQGIGPEAAGYLQNAGYSGGAALYDAFTHWLLARGEGAPEGLPADGFAARATAFFRDLGWGSLELGTVHDAVATVDTPDWAEADPATGLEFPGCYLTTGMFADFFGRLAGNTMAVMEVECRSTGAERCRFLVGSADLMQQVYDAMAQGVRYEDAVNAAR